MSENTIIWMEIIFNLLYLATVWTLVVLMCQRLPLVTRADKKAASVFTWAFFLLALGDTGHVGFRVWAYALGDLGATVNLLGNSLPLVGAGALSTAVTVTFFYVLVVVIWHHRYQKPYGLIGWTLFLTAAVRFVIMALPGNQWSSVVPPKPMSLIRNIPLIIQGLGAVYLILRDAFQDKDRLFTWIGVFIILSYLFYIPVILFVQQVPMLGMLMIPKTVMYVLIAWAAYRNIFIPKSVKS